MFNSCEKILNTVKLRRKNKEGMEVDDGNRFTKSNFENLKEQVENQSEFCDVTLEIGNWSKKFHKCVLSASLLFQIIFDLDITDTEKGIKANTLVDDHLKINIETSPKVAEMAIMFLYGRHPEFDMENIGDILEIAEYLMIKELKHACINWLNKLDYSYVECMFVVRLSTKYDFDVHSCNEYIESHIPDILLKDEATALIPESVEYLFLNEKFSYVNVVDKVNFLVKWVITYPLESTRNSTVTLLKSLGINEEIVHTIASNDSFALPMINVGDALTLKEQDSSRKHLVLMTFVKDYIACLDLKNSRWYRINSNHFLGYQSFSEISGIRNDNPEIYFKEYSFFGSNIITTFDLESEQINTYELQLDLDDDLNEETEDENIMHVCFKNDTVVIVVKTAIQTYEIANSPDVAVVSPGMILNISSANVLHVEQILESPANCVQVPESQANVVHVEQIPESPVNGFQVEQMPESPIHDLQIDEMSESPVNDIQADQMSDSSFNRQSTSSSISDKNDDNYIYANTVYIGNASEHFIEMSPLFTFRKEEIVKICIDNKYVLALLTRSDGLMHVVLYDMTLLKMERVFSLQEGKYTICSTKNGFLLHDDTHCYCLTKLEVPFFSKKYKVEKFKLDNEGYWFVKYRYQSEYWLRILRRKIQDDFEFQYISHKELAISNTLIDVHWETFATPEDENVVKKFMNFETIFIASISKSKLRCNISCPHCKYLFDYELLRYGLL